MKGRCVIRSLARIMRGEERVKEQYSLVNHDVWIRDLDME